MRYVLAFQFSENAMYLPTPVESSHLSDKIGEQRRPAGWAFASVELPKQVLQNELHPTGTR